MAMLTPDWLLPDEVEEVAPPADCSASETRSQGMKIQ